MTSLRHSWFVLAWVCAAFGPATLGCNKDAKPSSKPGGSCEAAQWDLILKPGEGGTTRTRGFAAGEQPSIHVDTSRVPKSDAIEVSLSECGGQAAATRVFSGNASFDVMARDKWSLDGWTIGKAGDPLAASCLYLTALATKEGRPIGAQYVTLHRGNFVIRGQATVPTGFESSATSVSIAIDVGSTTRTANVEKDGSFEVTHVAPGLVKTVRARLRVGTELFTGSSHPLVTLDAQNATAEVSVALAKSIPVRDRLEPDDDVSEVAARSPLALRTAEDHTLGSKADVDVIPFEVVSGRTYRVSLSPDETAEGDFGLEILDATGNPLLEKNKTPSDFAASPFVDWKATFTGKAHARITRNDDGASPARCSVEIDLTAIN